MIYDENYVRAVIESAGRTLAMGPQGFGKPKGYMSGWPEVLREMVLLVHTEGDNKGIEVIMPEVMKVRQYANTKQATELEMVFDWMLLLANYCKDKHMRIIPRTVWIGMLHNPVTDRRLFSWRRIGKETFCCHLTAKKRYLEGIEIIARLLNAKKN